MSVTAANVRALTGAVTRSYEAGGTVNQGDAVYLASTGKVLQADANVSAVEVEAIGVVVAGSDVGETAFESGDRVTVCVFGPVGGFASLTPGARQFVSSTAGAVAESAPSGAGTWTKAVGYAETAAILFVLPGISAASSNS